MTLPRPLLTLTILLVGPLFGQAPVKVLGKELPKVPGPLTGGRVLVDQGPQAGDSGMELRFRRSARANGSLPAVVVPAGNVSIEHAVSLPAGWMAYRVATAPMETVKARLKGDHEAWFAVKVVNKWGELEEGMLQNRIPTGYPQASFINVTDHERTVFFVVDTRTLFSNKEPYTLTFVREKTPPPKP